MKVLIITVLLMSVTLLPATDFILKDGSTVIGTLKGIMDQNIYVVSANNQLHILPFDTVQAINDGSGDVSYVWKLKKPFMEIDPQSYDLADNPNTLPVPAIMHSPLPPEDPNTRHLASISAALWTMNAFAITALVVSLLTYIHTTK